MTFCEMRIGQIGGKETGQWPEVGVAVVEVGGGRGGRDPAGVGSKLDAAGVSPVLAVDRAGSAEREQRRVQPNGNKGGYGTRRQCKELVSNVCGVCVWGVFRPSLIW